MRSYRHTRMVAPLGRRIWYRRVDWWFPWVVLLCAGTAVFIILSAAKAVKP